MYWGCIHSLFLAQKSNQNTWFSATLDFSLVFVGFLLSPPPYAQSFLRKPSLLVLADFFPWFFKSEQLLGFLGKKTKGEAENQRNAQLYMAESRNPGFLYNKTSVHNPLYFAPKENRRGVEDRSSFTSQLKRWIRAGIFKQSVEARNRVGIGLSYRPAWLHRPAEFIRWNRFLGSINV